MVNGSISMISQGLYYIYIIISPHSETKIMTNFGQRFLFPIKEYCDSNMYGNVNSDVRYGNHKSDTLSIQKKSDKFWKVKVKDMIENYFYSCLSDEEKQADYHLLYCGKNSVDFELLISRLAHLTKIIFSPKILQFVNNSFQNKDIILDEYDIIEMKPKIVHLDLIDYAEMMSNILIFEKRFSSGDQQPLISDIPFLSKLSTDLENQIQMSTTLSHYHYWLLINSFILQAIENKKLKLKETVRVLKQNHEFDKLFPHSLITTRFYCSRGQSPNGKFHFNLLIDVNINDKNELKLSSKIYALKGIALVN
jgi:hypothetical protein